MNDSEIVRHASGGVTFAGPDAVNFYRAVTLVSCLRMFARSGIKPTRGIGGPQMLALATQYTGKKYKRGQWLAAADDVKVWADTMKAALPISDSAPPPAEGGTP